MEESAIDLLESALNATQEGAELPIAVQAWLSQGLTEYASGEPLEKALSLSGTGRSVRNQLQRRQRDRLLKAAVVLCEDNPLVLLERLNHFQKYKFNGWKRVGVPEQASPLQLLLYEICEAFPDTPRSRNGILACVN